MPTKKTTTPLKSGSTYHVFNRGINKMTLFYRSENYDYFIKNCQIYLLPRFEILSYCLLNNHFHLILRVRDSSWMDQEEVSKDASERLRRLFITFVQAINKQEQRTGSLLNRPFRRVEISNEEYLKYLLFYIHWNPIKHKVAKSFEGYKHSSYRDFIKGKSRIVCVDKVLALFNNSSEEFFEFHRLMKLKSERDDIP